MSRLTSAAARSLPTKSIVFFVMLFLFCHCGAKGRYAERSELAFERNVRLLNPPRQINAMVLSINEDLSAHLDRRYQLFQNLKANALCDEAAARDYLPFAGTFEWSTGECLATIQKCQPQLQKDYEYPAASLRCLALDDSTSARSKLQLQQFAVENARTRSSQARMLLEHGLDLRNIGSARYRALLDSASLLKTQDRRMANLYFDVQESFPISAQDEADLLAWLASLLPEARGKYEAWAFIRIYSDVLVRGERYHDLIEFIDHHLEQASLSFIPALYLALFKQGNAYWEGLRAYYATHVSYANPAAYYANEHNSYTYSEMRETVCKGGLLEGEGLSAYLQTAARLNKGEISLDQAKQEFEKLLVAFGDSAEALTALAEMQLHDGDLDGAVNFAMRVRALCPYFERAHYLLGTIPKQRAVVNHPLFENMREQIKEKDASLIFDVEAAGRYIENYQALPSATQRALRVSLGLWLPYLGELAAKGSRLLLKFSFQKLGEIEPNLADQRVTGIAEDFRLWDDIRAKSGESRIILDINETKLGPYTGQNSVAHEVAHQIHRHLPRGMQGCIAKLYSQRVAMKDKGFVNAYSSSNASEYFAEAARISILPSSSPHSFGPNRRWFEQNDPDMIQLIQQFESGLALAQITCPQ